MNAMSYVGLYSLVLLPFIIAIQIFWIFGKNSDSKQLDKIKGIPKTERLEYKEYIVTYILIGSCTLIASYLVGFSASWSYAWFTDNSNTPRLWGKFGGVELFIISSFLYMVSLALIYRFKSRTESLSSADILADINEIDQTTPWYPEATVRHSITSHLNSSEDNFKEFKEKMKLSHEFDVLFEDQFETKWKLFDEQLKFATMWQFKKLRWAIVSAIIYALALSTVLFLSVAYISGANSHRAYLFMTLPVLVTILQSICSRSQLIYMGRLCRNNSNFFKNSHKIINKWHLNSGIKLVVVRHKKVSRITMFDILSVKLGTWNFLRYKSKTRY